MCITMMRVNVIRDNYFNDPCGTRSDEMFYPSKKDIERAVRKMVRRAKASEFFNSDVLFFCLDHDQSAALRLHYEYVDYKIHDDGPFKGCAYDGRYALMLTWLNAHHTERCEEVTVAKAISTIKSYGTYFDKED